jgi:hypothetical protein
MNKHIYIIITHYHNRIKREWVVTETIEFVNKIKTKHLETSAIIADFTDKKLIRKVRDSEQTYEDFDKYVREKYEKHMVELDKIMEAVNTIKVHEEIVNV